MKNKKAVHRNDTRSLHAGGLGCRRTGCAQRNHCESAYVEKADGALVACGIYKKQER